jgi:hypothetical protein
MVILRIKKKEFDLIKSGSKKTEWRPFSAYNKKLLFCKDKTRSDGKLNGNSCIKEINFINGYKSDAPLLIVEVKSIRLIKFSKDTVIKEDNFEALKDQFAIEIKLGKIKY